MNSTKLIKNILCLGVIGLLTSISQVNAQAPIWTVNPNQYQYSMTVTAIIELNCDEEFSPSNQIGAFVNDTLRGSANTSNVIAGRYQAIMTVYSDQVNGENIEFRFYDQSTDSIYQSVTQLAFQDNAIYGSPSNPIIVGNNNQPQRIILSSDSIEENSASGSIVGSLSALDPDAGQSHSFSLVAGSGSSDNSLFSISGSNLIANFVGNYEVKNLYRIRLRTTDTDGCTLDSAFSIFITNKNDPPTAINLSSNQINENNSVNDIVAFLTAIDSDQNEAFTFALESGAGGDDNSDFFISGNELRASTSFNFEQKSSYKIRIRVTDAAMNAFSDSLVILIGNVNELPTDITITSDSIVENSAPNAIITTLVAVDEDQGQSHIFSFDNVAGNDNDKFNIVGNTLRAKNPFDFETLNSYFVYVQANDLNGGLFTKLISIRVIDANDAPTDIQLSNNTVNEASPIGTFVGVVSSIDQDNHSNYTYSFVAGVGDVNNGSFQISNDSLFSNAVFDFATKNSYSIRLRTDDGQGGQFSKAFTIGINDVNNAPTDIFLSNNIVFENAALGSVVGQLSSADADANDSHTYTLVPGAGDADNDDFTILNNEVRTDTVFDFTVKTSYSIRVRSTDSQNGSFEKIIQINVVNANDAPTDITLVPNNVNENLPPNSLVGTLDAADPDPTDQHTFTFVNLTANDNASFVLVGDELRTATSFDFETKAFYIIQVQADDGNNGLYSRQLSVVINDTNDVPTDISLSSNQVREKQAIGEFVAKITTQDQDANDSFTYTLVSGLGDDDNADFSISNDSLFTSSILDVLVKDQLSIRLRSQDATNRTVDKSLLIDVLDVNDAPTDISLSNSSVFENVPINTVIANLSTIDPDPTQTFNYSLVSGSGDVDNGKFTISGNELRTNAAFDFNLQDSLRIRVRSTDQGNLNFEKEFIVQVLNSNDAPTDINLNPSSFNENLPLSSTIGTFSTADKDSNDVFSYSFVNGGNNDNALFIISGNELRTGSSFDFETKALYVIEVQTRDAGAASFSRQITVNVLDSNDAPTAITLSADSILEKNPVGTYIADLNTIDVDANDSFTYSLVAGQGATDNAYFRVNGNLLESDSVFDYNDARNRRIRLRSTDQNGASTEQSFTIRIKNVNDLPTDILLSDTTFLETLEIGNPVGSLATVDEDQNDVFTYALVQGAGDNGNQFFAINGSQLVANSFFDFETQTQYSVRIRSTDQAGGSIEKSFNIEIIDGNEPPSVADQFFTIQENLSAGTLIGRVEVEDSDANQNFSFRIIEAQSDFSIDANSGDLFSSRTFDYENRSSYSIRIEVSDIDGLRDSATIEVTIQDQIENTLPAASYFSPNGDGINDNWSIENVALYSNYRLMIFAASGELVYDKASNYNNDWDGTQGGEELPDGVYFFYMQDPNTPSSEFKGTITLKR